MENINKKEQIKTVEQQEKSETENESTKQEKAIQEKQEPQQKKQKQEHKEKKLVQPTISQTLNELVEFKSIKNAPLVGNGNETKIEYQKRLGIEEKEFEKVLKKNGLSFYLQDTLVVPPKERMNMNYE